MYIVPSACKKSPVHITMSIIGLGQCLYSTIATYAVTHTVHTQYTHSTHTVYISPGSETRIG
jgi:hypothetical protein